MIWNIPWMFFYNIFSFQLSVNKNDSFKIRKITFCKAIFFTSFTKWGLDLESPLLLQIGKTIKTLISA